MGLFSRRKTASSSSSSPYQCEEAIESTSSFGSISHTPGATSRAFLPLGHMTDEPESTVSSLSAASGSAYSYSYSTANLAMSLARTDSPGPGMPSPAPRPNSRPRPRLHASASHHNLSHQGLTMHSVRAPPPLPSLPPQPHSNSTSASMSSYSYSSYSVPQGYLPMKSTPNLHKPPPSDVPSPRMYNTNASRVSPRRGLGSNKEASASRASLATAGRSLARVPSLWKKKFRRSQNSTNSDTSDSSAASKSSR